MGCALGKQGFPPSKQSKANSLCPPAPQAGHVPPEPPASLPWAALFPQGHRRSAGPAATGRHKSPMYAWAGGCVWGGCPSNFGVRRFHLPTSRVCVCVCPRPASARLGLFGGTMAPPAPLWPYKAEGHQAAGGDSRGSNQPGPPAAAAAVMRRGPLRAAVPGRDGATSARGKGKGTGTGLRGRRRPRPLSSNPGASGPAPPYRPAHAQPRPGGKRKRRLGSVARCR